MSIRPFLIALSISAATLSAMAQAPVAGSNWQRVQQLPTHSRVHISSDKMSRVCSIDSVDEDTLTCSTGHMVSTSHYTFPRSEIKEIKATRYTLSTVGGAAIGAGAGLVTGVAIAHGNQGSFTIVSNTEVWGVATAVGGIVGAAICGPADLLRGPTIYRRP